MRRYLGVLVLATAMCGLVLETMADVPHSKCLATSGGACTEVGDAQCEDKDTDGAICAFCDGGGTAPSTFCAADESYTCLGNSGNMDCGNNFTGKCGGWFSWSCSKNGNIVWGQCDTAANCTGTS